MEYGNTNGMMVGGGLPGVLFRPFLNVSSVSIQKRSRASSLSEFCTCSNRITVKCWNV